VRLTLAGLNLPCISRSFTMLSLIIASALPFLLATTVSGQFTPTTPSPGDSFNAGHNCTIAWRADQTGAWSNVTINLMSGSNMNMTMVTNVISGLDGTDPTLSTFAWPCPDVSPHSAIYFYEFTNGGDVLNSKWTSRFTIASSTGYSVTPEYSQQPNGEAGPWGIGHLVEDNPSGQDNPSVENTSPEGDTNDDDLDSTEDPGTQAPPSSSDNGTYRHYRPWKSARPGHSEGDEDQDQPSDNQDAEDTADSVDQDENDSIADAESDSDGVSTQADDRRTHSGPSSTSDNSEEESTETSSPNPSPSLSRSMSPSSPTQPSRVQDVDTSSPTPTASGFKTVVASSASRTISVLQGARTAIVSVPPAQTTPTPGLPPDRKDHKVTFSSSEPAPSPTPIQSNSRFGGALSNDAEKHRVSGYIGFIPCFVVFALLL